MKAQVFLRVDHPTLLSLVDSFGEEIGDEELQKVEGQAIELDFNKLGIGYDMCMKGSKRFDELIRDDRYVEKTYNPAKGKNP